MEAREEQIPKMMDPRDTKERNGKEEGRRK